MSKSMIFVSLIDAVRLTPRWIVGLFIVAIVIVPGVAILPDFVMGKIVQISVIMSSIATFITHFVSFFSNRDYRDAIKLKEKVEYYEEKINYIKKGSNDSILTIRKHLENNSLINESFKKDIKGELDKIQELIGGASNIFKESDIPSIVDKMFEYEKSKKDKDKDKNDK